MTTETPEVKSPCWVHCKDCGHEWAAFWTPLTLDRQGLKLLKSVSTSPCPKCAGKKVFMGRAA